MAIFCHFKGYGNLGLLKCLYVCYNGQHKHFEIASIISGPYLILMYNMKKFLQAVSEELHQMDGLTYRPIPRSPPLKEGGEAIHDAHHNEIGTQE